jgi:putative FmdB family regulatory protein
MARILFDHECPECGHQFEEFVNTGSPETVNCPECTAPATKLITGTTIDPRLGVDADRFPTMGDKWARVREQRQKIEAKKVRDHGPDA